MLAQGDPTSPERPLARRLTPLLAVEVAALLCWVGLAVAFVSRQTDQGQLVPLSSESLTAGAGEERWMGIYFQDQHVGYSVSRTTAADQGGRLIEERSRFTVASFGAVQQVITAGAALVDSSGALRRFDFFMSAEAVRLSVRGEVRGDEIVMEVDQAGEVNELRFPISAPPQVSLSLEATLARQPMAVGHSFSVPYFDPITMSEGSMDVRVTGVEVLENGEEAWWLTSKFGDIETRALVLPTGETLRQEGALGLSVVRMTAEAAQDLPAGVEPVDLIALSAVKLKGRLDNARESRHLRLRIEGVEPERVRHEPPLQVRAGDEVTVDIPLLLELPALAVRAAAVGAPDLPPELLPTMSLPSSHREIVDRAQQVVGDATDRLTAVQRLNRYVFESMEKAPTMGVPNGLEALRSMRGDCNEHTALFVSLARAAGIPARIAAGVVYSDRIGERGAFYYHAWPEVQLGGPTDWVPVDPTFGQVPADATHVKLVEGDLDRQVEIMAVMGKLGFELLEAR